MAQVRVTEGLLQGEVVKGALGREYYSFKGIPYAAPPIGDLRFKAPKLPQSWKGVRNATEHGSICHQFDLFTKSVKSGSEDCLYLNVYSPNIKPSSLLPVMVWIHGGGFMSGSGNDDFYGPDFLIERDVVLVTFNYRLEVLGFLCLDTEDVPGNAGAKDQVMALRWVQKNIRYFGGDPENVTIFGESAGAACTSFHLFSPMSKGLFKRAIVQSGSMNCPWGLSFEPRERALATARNLGYEGQSDKDLHAFFMKLPIQSLIGIRTPVTMSEASSTMFNIVNEKKFGDNERFFYGDIYEHMRQGIHENVDVLIGFNADEGLLMLSLLPKEIIDTTLNRFIESFAPSVIRLQCKISDHLEAGRQLKNYYFGKDKVDANNAIKMSDFYGMNNFVFPMMQWAKFHVKTKANNLYIYKFTCQSERNIMSKYFDPSKFVTINKPVTAHADDLPYLFPFKVDNLPLDKSSKSFNMIQNITKLWTDFARYGNPTPDSSLGVKWSPFTLEQEEYLDIGEKLVPENNPFKEDLRFWESICYKFLPNTKP